jgi:hypothetical protein
VKEIRAATDGGTADNVYEAACHWRFAAENEVPVGTTGVRILRDLIWKRNDGLKGCACGDDDGNPVLVVLPWNATAVNFSPVLRAWLQRLDSNLKVSFI